MCFKYLKVGHNYRCHENTISWTYIWVYPDLRGKKDTKKKYRKQIE